jgi:hypothetical protein
MITVQLYGICNKVLDLSVSSVSSKITVATSLVCSAVT